MAGILLILLGIIGIFDGNFIFMHKTTERGLGPLRLEHQETRSVPLPPVFSGLVLLGGIALVAAGARK